MKWDWKYIVGAILLVVLLVVIIKAIRKAIDDKRALDTFKDSQQGKFNAEPYAEAIYVDLDSWFSTSSVYTSLAKRTDDEIRQVWLYWEQKIKNRKGSYFGYSLGKALFDTTFWNSTSSEAVNEIVKKLKALNLP